MAGGLKLIINRWFKMNLEVYVVLILFLTLCIETYELKPNSYEVYSIFSRSFEKAF